MSTLRRFFTSIRTRRDKLIVLLLAITVIYSIASSSLRQPWRKIAPRFHAVTNNTLPLELAWSYTTSEVIKVPPLMNDQVVVVLHGDDVLTALDIQAGSVKWEYTLDSDIGLPDSRFVYDLDEEHLVIAVNNAQLLALDTGSGQKIWQRDLSSLIEPTSNIMLVGDIVIVSAFSTYPSTEGYVASYQLDNGDFIAHMFVPSRTFQYQFSCPSALENNGSSEQTICIALYDRLWIINSAEELRVVDTNLISLYSLDIPYYQAGFIFTNPSPLPSPHVFDIRQKEEFVLPAECSRDSTSYPVSSYGDLVLVSNGCNNLYTLNINQLEQEPDWIFSSDDEIFSSFVTIDGEIGYTLNAKGEIVGINLANGTEIGRVLMEPNQLERGQFRNSLFVNAPYLYALMDGNTLLVFKQRLQS